MMCCWCTRMAGLRSSSRTAEAGMSRPTITRKLLLALNLLVLIAPAWSAANLAEALDQVWQRALTARVAEARQTEIVASRAVADSLLAAPPALSISQRDDRFNRNRGLREHELELALPLWLPGQREARRILAEREGSDSEAALAAARLALAGELRSAVWALTSAQAESEIVRRRLALAEQLAADVARREAAGDLARTDLLLAREEMLAAKAALAESNSRERQAFERYRLLTGSETLPTRIDEEIAPAAAESHPRRRLAEAAAERARAEMQFARENRRDSPELTIGWQQTREDSAAKDQHSLRFRIRIPFASEARNAPRIAAANSSIIRAEAEYRQVMAEVDGERREAASRLDDTQLALQASDLRATLAAERLHHLERAFALGELSLSDLVRVRGAANEARLEATRARLAHAAARARFNQAQGILP